MHTGPSEPTGKNVPMPGNSPPSKTNARLALGLTLFAIGMVGLSFAAVPLYRIFCARTGFAGTPQRAAAAPSNVTGEIVRVRFDANVSPGLNWSFAPVQREMALHIGENKLAFFRATNLSSQTLTGTATFNVTPDIMGAYFTKIQCFCFQEQTLKPGETVDMPVSFYVDPAVLKDPDAKNIRDIALSYTFFRAQKTADTPPSATRSTARSGTGTGPAYSGRPSLESG